MDRLVGARRCVQLELGHGKGWYMGVARHANKGRNVSLQSENSGGRAEQSRQRPPIANRRHADGSSVAGLG